jgi:hypothetical protein
LEGKVMNRRVGVGIAVVVALVVGLLFFGLQRQRAMAEAQAVAERNAAEAARRQAEEALRRERKGIAEPGQPRWEYRVLSVEGSDDAVNQALNQLIGGRSKYVGVVQPASGPKGVYAARTLFRRMKP